MSHHYFKSICCFSLFLLISSCATPEKKIYERGLASWYGKQYHGRKTASGETYNMYAMTAAHKTLPFGTRVQVISETTGKQVVVKINDRGPFIRHRIIDLSKKAAENLGIIKKGHDQVKLIVLK